MKETYNNESGKIRLADRARERLSTAVRNPQIQFVKGFYQRPLRVGEKIQAGGGGRVTELTARPLLNLFYPELSGVVQPLEGSRVVGTGGKNGGRAWSWWLGFLFV